MEAERCRVRERFFMTFGESCQNVDRCAVSSLFSSSELPLHSLFSNFYLFIYFFVSIMETF